MLPTLDLQSPSSHFWASIVALTDANMHHRRVNTLPALNLTWFLLWLSLNGAARALAIPPDQLLQNPSQNPSPHCSNPNLTPWQSLINSSSSASTTADDPETNRPSVDQVIRAGITKVQNLYPALAPRLDEVHLFPSSLSRQPPSIKFAAADILLLTASNVRITISGQTWGTWGTPTMEPAPLPYIAVPWNWGYLTHDIGWAITRFRDAGYSDRKWDKVFVQMDTLERRLYWGFWHSEELWLILVYDDDGEVKKTGAPFPPGNNGGMDVCSDGRITA